MLCCKLIRWIIKHPGSEPIVLWWIHACSDQPAAVKTLLAVELQTKCLASDPCQSCLLSFCCGCGAPPSALRDFFKEVMVLKETSLAGDTICLMFLCSSLQDDVKVVKLSQQVEKSHTKRSNQESEAEAGTWFGF